MPSILDQSSPAVVNRRPARPKARARDRESRRPDETNESSARRNPPAAPKVRIPETTENLANEILGMIPRESTRKQRVCLAFLSAYVQRYPDKKLAHSHQTISYVTTVRAIAARIVSGEIGELQTIWRLAPEYPRKDNPPEFSCLMNRFRVTLADRAWSRWDKYFSGQVTDRATDLNEARDRGLRRELMDAALPELDRVLRS